MLAVRRKKRKKDERTALRNQRAEAQPLTDETNPPLEEKQS
jgi:hypothetical protein